MAQEPSGAASRTVMDLTAEDDDEDEGGAFGDTGNAGNAEVVVLGSKQKRPGQHLDMNTAHPSHRKLPVSLQPGVDSGTTRAQQEIVPSALNLQPRPPMSTTVSGAARIEFNGWPLPGNRPLPMSLSGIRPPTQYSPITSSASTGLVPYTSSAAMLPNGQAHGMEQAPASAQQAGPVTGAESHEAMQAVVDALSVSSVQPADPPPETMVVTLLKHQRLALGWMLSREGAAMGKKALCPDGGILADDQGLGKTVSTIALLVSNHVEPVKPWGRVQVDLNQPKPPKRLKWDPPSGATAPSRTAAAGGAAAAAQAEQPAAAPLPAADSGAAAATGGGVPVSDGAAGARGPQGAAGGGGAGAPPIAASGVAPAAAAETSVAAPADAGDKGATGGLRADAVGGAAAADAGPTVGSGHGGKRRLGASIGAGGKPLAGTLIVAPTSLLKQWESEIKGKVHPSQRFITLVYHGKERDRATSCSSLCVYSVVITSYTMLANECGIVSTIKGKNEFIDLASDDEEDGPGGKKSGKKPRKHGDSGLLFQVRWQRVVLDEGQMIKNPRTRVAQAAWALAATHRWILSGTPIQNSVGDLYSYFRFLKWAPFDKQAVFRAQIADAIKFNPEKGYRKLQQVLKGVLLRRTKYTTLDGKPILNLPTCRQMQDSIALDSHERAFYDDLKRQSEAVVSGLREGASGDAYFNALAHLMRLRQACCHPALVRRQGADVKAPTAEEVAAARALPQQMKVDLLEVLLGADASGRSGCVACQDVADSPVAAHCGHILCRSCAMALLSQGGAEPGRVGCPACGTLMRLADVHSAAALAATSKAALPPHLRAAVLEIQRGGEGGASEVTKGQPSSKIRRLMEVLNTVIRGRPAGGAAGDTSQDTAPAVAAPPPALKAAPFLGRRSKSSAILSSIAKSKRPAPPRPAAAAAVTPAAMAAATAAQPRTGSKVIVFSQWTSMLDLVEAALAVEGLPFRRLDGTMTLAARDAQLADFKQDPAVVVLLLSLRAASLGLNLVVANHVVLLDLWWNPAVEDQAIDRTHRIGQTRDVTVTRITVKDSVEERILELQKKKREVMDAAFSDAAAGSSNRLTGEDLLFLFS